MTVLRMAPVVLCLAWMGVSVAEAQWTPAPGEPLLGRFHLWLKSGQADFDHQVAREWGVDRKGYLALEGYRGTKNDVYFGGEIARVADDRSINARGQTLRDLDLLWVELNVKTVLELRGNLSFGVGGGAALFYVDGEEITIEGGEEISDPLADLALGSQLFIDLTWRHKRLLLGADARYQWAFDVINVNYSNLRLGAHVGLAF
ncbi:MAG TPA: hypothetical protein VNL37_00725 [Candidatus Polarisedimenticolia bacterium]|nr:hypothetical protein [Candidatus Polarisedimenticolia bacterium]